MQLKIVLIPLLAAAATAPDIVGDVRAAIAQNNFALGESLLQRYQTGQGVTPEMIEALSWLGRGALAAGQLDPADGYAERTRKLALEHWKSSPIASWTPNYTCRWRLAPQSRSRLK